MLDVGSIGVGAYLGYTSAKWQYNYFGSDWGYKYSSLIIGARGTFHYPLVEKLDTYTGIMLGVNIVTDKSFGDIDPHTITALQLPVPFLHGMPAVAIISATILLLWQKLAMELPGLHLV
ncbi:MAG: hypothetical protein IPH20_19675 [Bacteroidales bacterium]|nr:hypothetical protein [Bacteroidales bacterium]